MKHLLASLLGIGALTAASPAWTASEIKMTHGWSVNADPAAAIDESFGALKKKGVKGPKLVVAYFTEQYDPQKIVDKAKQAYPGVKIYGQTVYKGVFSSDGLHIGPNGSIAVLAFEGEGFDAGIAGAEVADGADAKSLATEAIKSAIQQAGHKETDVPAVALIAAKKGTEEQTLAGISSVLAKESPLIGGTASTNKFAIGPVIANDKVIKQGMVAGVLYSKQKSGAYFFSGFVGAKKFGKVTEAKGRLLKTLDGKPAQEVFKSWAGGKFDHIKPVKEDIMTMETAVAPLAKKITLADGQERLVAVRPQKFMADQSLLLGGDVEVGETLYYVEGTKDALVKRAGVVAKKALVDGKIKMNEVAGGLHIYCAGASTVIGLEEGGSAGAMVKEIVASMNGKPFIGGFTSAEQGHIPGFGFFNGNLMSSMVVFAR